MNMFGQRRPGAPSARGIPKLTGSRAVLGAMISGRPSAGAPADSASRRPRRVGLGIAVASCLVLMLLWSTAAAPSRTAKAQGNGTNNWQITMADTTTTWYNLYNFGHPTDQSWAAQSFKRPGSTTPNACYIDAMWLTSVEVALSQCGSDQVVPNLNVNIRRDDPQNGTLISSGLITPGQVTSFDPYSPTWVTVNLPSPIHLEHDVTYYVQLQVQAPPSPGPIQYCQQGRPWGYVWSLQRGGPYTDGSFYPILPYHPYDGLSKLHGYTQGPETTKVKVLALYYDRMLDDRRDGHTGEQHREHEILPGGLDPSTLTDDYAGTMSSASGGTVQYQVVDRRYVEEWPEHVGTVLAPIAPLTAWTDDLWWYDYDTPGNKIPGCHGGATLCDQTDVIHSPAVINFDYDWMLHGGGGGAGKTPLAMLQDGDIDEIWMWSENSSGHYESISAGPNAYYVNGGPWPGYDSGPNATPRMFVMMDFSYILNLGYGLHSEGHRSESIMSHTLQGTGVWDDFIRRYNQANPPQTYAGLGAIHFPFNTTSEYNYSVTTQRQTTADGWYHYPDYLNPAYLSNKGCAAWNCGQGDDQEGFMEFWFDHIPRYPGNNGNAGGTRNNWWPYITLPGCFP